MSAAEDWDDVVARVTEGDRLALLKLTRLITSYLTRWRAYDFRDEWDDLIQDTVIAVVGAREGGRIRDRRATSGYIRGVARRKFIDLLRRVRVDLLEGTEDRLPWEPEAPAEASGLLEIVERLPEKQRQTIWAVYVEGRTREDAARTTGIPLGSLKRYQRQALATLRATLDPSTATESAADEESRANLRARTDL